jgi:hypothetical protein
MNSSNGSNSSVDPFAGNNAETHAYVFDRADVRAIFITLYTVVFCCCFFGKYH